MSSIKQMYIWCISCFLF